MYCKAHSVRRRLGSWLSALVALLALILASPKPAHAYVDPGSGAMLWQMAAAALVGSLFYVHRVARWIRRVTGSRSPRTIGFLFASCFALVTSPLVYELFGSQPVPRFNDVFLIGIVLTSYLYTWEPAAFLLVISLVFSAWIMPHGGTWIPTHTQDWYRLCSFAAVSIFLICLVTQMKSRYASRLPDSQQSDAGQ